MLHTATPIIIPMEGEEPQSKAEAQAQQLDPAVEGVIGVIEQCQKAGIKQIVLTSSNAAVTGKAVTDIPVSPSSGPHIVISQAQKVCQEVKGQFVFFAGGRRRNLLVGSRVAGK